jgi:hypothetical protein
MIVISAIYAPWLLTATGSSSVNDFFSWCFIVWAGCLWLFFPFGALLGGSILKRLRGLSLRGTAMAGLGIGLVSGLLLTLALFLVLGRDELIGLMQGGSPGFVLSVTQQLHKLAWHLGTSVWPLTTGIVLLWAIFRKADEPSLPGGELVSGESPRVRLRLGPRHLATWGLLAGIMAVATTALAIKETPAHKLALFFLGAAGVPVLGPWIGPAINPGGGYDEARRLAYVATPVLLVAAAPFLLRLRVRPRMATICWCGFLTALLFWLAIGIFSALSSMG